MFPSQYKIPETFKIPSSYSIGGGLPPTLPSWSYRKSHIINGSSTGAVSNYPIKITVHYGAGTDSGADVYLNGKCRTDFGDIRFRDADGVTELSYWMEKYVASDYAIFWVKVPSIPVSPGTATIYIYYGNSSATTTSNQFITGLAQLKEHRWATFSPDIQFSKPSAGILRELSTTSSIGEGFIFWVVPKDWINGKYLRFHWVSSATYSSFPFDLLVWDGIYLRSSDTDFPDGAGIPMKGAGEILKYEKTGTFDRIDDILINVSSAQYDFVTILFRIADSWSAQSGQLDLDWVEVNTGSGGVGNIAREDFNNSVVMELTGTYKDYGLYRNYISPEPSHGAWGSEESL
jgi:hypothetical protein